ncbi:MAG: flavin reductase family protein [Alphaproteobacteria bacterium]|nr:flavin reductase family protein [Alphaproteobacteria bacterium]
MRAEAEGRDVVESEFGAEALRSALGRFATGVTVITCRLADGGLVGLTANSFNSVSLDPPLILWSLSKRARSLEAFRSATHFGVNVLAWDQVEIARRFSQRVANRFAGIAFHEGEGGVPLLDGCVARFVCVTHHQYEGGDHLIFVGRVHTCSAEDKPALVYYGSRYAMTRDHPSDQ